MTESNNSSSLPKDVFLEGDIIIGSEGCATCNGNCSIISTFFPSYVSNQAFSFQVVDFLESEVPIITFGLKEGGKYTESPTTFFSFTYFDFLSTFRSSASPLIPYDGIGVTIHMILEENNFNVCVNNEFSSFPLVNVPPKASYFLEIVQKGVCEIFLPFQSNFCQSSNTFFPNLIPRLWTCLPFLIQIRDFNIRGNTSLRSVYSEVPLANLPGTKIKYYEVIIRSTSATSSSHSGIYIGLVEQPHAASECPPGRTQLSIGFSTISKTMSISSEEYDVQIGPITSGHVIGIGVSQTNGVFLTYDGVMTDPDTFPDPSFSQYIPVVSVVGSADEVIVNLGQLPFKYEGITPPIGWTLYNKTPSHMDQFEKGPPPENHLLNFFPFTSILGSPSYIESFVSSRPLKNNGRFEVTILSKTNDDVIVLGLSSGDYIQGGACGWDKKTLGVHSDDGMLYRENGRRGKMNIIDPNEVSQGKTIGMALQDTSVSFTINKDKYNVVSDFTLLPLPTISAIGQISFIANFGEVPFVFTDTNKTTDGVKLFNGVTVVMTNNDLYSTGLNPGDYIESRDLSLRGLFVGEFKGHYFIVVDGIDGAVPLIETDPLIIRTTYKILYSHVKNFKPMITFSDCIMANLGLFERRSLYASRYGIAFMIGQTTKGSYVMRPIVDLMNNSHCFVLEEKPPNILKSISPEIEPVFFQHGISFLDVIEDSDQTLMLMLGSQNGQIVGWNNVSISPLKGEPKIVFRFNGIAFVSVTNLLMVNVGEQRGGRYFPPNYHGTSGSQFYQHSTSQRSYGSKGMMPIPSAVNLLFTSLNEQFTINSEAIASRILNRPTLDPSMIYDIEDEGEDETPVLPLVTHSK